MKHRWQTIPPFAASFRSQAAPWVAGIVLLLVVAAEAAEITVAAEVAEIGEAAQSAQAQARSPIESRALVERALAHTELLLNRARRAVASSRSERARLLLDEAAGMQAQARARLAERDFRSAYRLTRQARESVERVLALARGGSAGRERVLASLQRTDGLLDRVREEVRESEDSRAEMQLQVALELQNRAEREYASGSYAGALRMTVNARDQALRAARWASAIDGRRVPAASQVARAIQRTQGTIEDARAEVESDGNEAAAVSLEAAERLQARARRELARGAAREALELTLEARESANRSLQLVDEES